MASADAPAALVLDPPDVPARAASPGRKAVISREDIVVAALRLVGPHRSVSSLSLREVAREAGIAPNSFYRQFRDMDERAAVDRSVVRGSVEAFMEQLQRDDKLLHILLREGSVGSDAFKQAVDRQLTYFEEELRHDLVRLAQANGTGLFEAGLTAKAIPRLVFTMGATAMDLPRSEQGRLAEELILMVRMIVAGTQTMAAMAPEQVAR